MVLDNIEQLLTKYENGKTTLKEEAQLKDYFSQETVAPHLEMYKPMFVYFLQNQEEAYTKDVPLNPKRNVNYFKWISVAAVVALMFGFYTQINKPVTPKTLTGEQLIAYNQTVEALSMLSSTFNKGKQNLRLDAMSTNFNKGTQSIDLVDTFTETTNKIFKTK